MNKYFRMPAAAVLMLLSFVWLPASAEQVDEVREARPDAVIEFLGVTGEITIVGREGEELALRGKLGDDVDRVRIDGDPSSWRIEIEMKKSEGSNWNWSAGPGTVLELTVPPGADLTSRAVSADVSIRGVRGPRIDARTVSGDLALVESSPSRLIAETVSGDIEIDGGGLESSQLKSVSGDIEAIGLVGRVRAESVSGDLEIDAIDVSEFNAETVSGDLETTLRPGARATIDVQSHSGSIDLAMPAGTPVDLDAETFSGDLASRFTADTEQFREDGMTVRHGDASVRVRAQTFSGEFVLLESDG